MKKTLLLFSFLCFANLAAAQIKIEGQFQLGDTTQTHTLFTKKGDRMVGRVVGFDEQEIRFLMLGNMLTFPIAEVEKIVVESMGEKIEKKNTGSPFPELKPPPPMDESGQPSIGNEESATAPFPALKPSLNYDPTMRPITRNFISPTALMLEKGQGEFRNTGILFNSLEYGLGKNITIGANAATIFAASLVGLRAKAGFSPAKLFHLSVSGQMNLGLTSFSESAYQTAIAAAATIGTLENNVSLSYTKHTFIDSGSEVVNFLGLAASIRTGLKSRIFAEYNHIHDEDVSESLLNLNLGGSWFKENNRVDFGLSLSGSDGEIYPLPFAAYSRYF